MGIGNRSSRLGQSVYNPAPMGRSLIGCEDRGSLSSAPDGGLRPFDFNPNLVTFTPGMAKRATSVFVAAPIVQGKRDGTGTPDKLSTGYTSIVGRFYNTFDLYQGSIVFWITPEWNGNDNLSHAILANNDPGTISLYKTSVNTLKLQDYSGVVSMSVNVAAWVAGTRYCVICRWDTKNTLDGTNYMCVSINDVHTFGVVAIFVPGAPFELTIGSIWNPAISASAIIEGLTIYRRVLYDGAYGTDVGNGDEVNLISAGVDPCTITGSWDVCFCLPTNATPGALVTGTGEAWSHPHGSNLIPPIDGFMADTAWNNWIAAGAPAGGAVLAMAEKIFAWGYKFTATGAGDGYKKVIAVVAGDIITIRGIAHSDGTGQPKLQVWDEVANALIVQLTGTIASTRTIPDNLLMTFVVPAGCNSISIQCLNAAATNIVYWHQIELYTNLYVDPGVEVGTAVTDVGTPTTSAQSADQAHSGANSWKIVADAIGEGFKRTINVTSGKFYHVSAWIYALTAATTVDLEFNNAVLQDGITPRKTTTVVGAWQNLRCVVRATAATMDVQFTGNQAAQTFYVDDVAVF